MKPGYMPGFFLQKKKKKKCAHKVCKYRKCAYIYIIANGTGPGAKTNQIMKKQFATMKGSVPHVVTASSKKSAAEKLNVPVSQVYRYN